MKRVQELEPVESLEEAKEYNLTEKKHLSWIDDCFVESVLSMGINHGKILDVGTGPGWIPIKITKKNPYFKIYAMDLSEVMLDIAKKNAINEKVNKRIQFYKAAAENIPFNNNYFDLVISHSTLHHVNQPISFLDEINRVVKEDGAILIRDLKRPSKFFLNFYVSFFGLPYTPIVKKMYRNSLKAAYTSAELEGLLNRSKIDNAKITKYFITHIGIKKVSPRKENILNKNKNSLLPAIKKFYVENYE